MNRAMIKTLAGGAAFTLAGCFLVSLGLQMINEEQGLVSDFVGLWVMGGGVSCLFAGAAILVWRLIDAS